MARLRGLGTFLLLVVALAGGSMAFSARKPKPTPTVPPTVAVTVAPTATATATATVTIQPTETLPPTATPATVEPSPVAGTFDLQFPRQPLTAGDMPERATTGVDAWDDFTNLDYEGWGNLNGINERFEAVPDPAGSGRIVVETFNVSTDTDDQYANSNPHTQAFVNRDQTLGVTQCSAFGIYFRDATEFPWPKRWMLVFQDQSQNSPNDAVEIGDTSADADTLRNELTYRVRNGAGTDSGINYPLGPILYGRWHYLVTCMYYADVGWGKAWLAYDRAPDTSQPPTAQRTGVDTWWYNGKPALGIYKDAFTPAETHQVYLWGYGRSDNPARAVALARLPEGP